MMTKKGLFPLISNFTATTVFRAFILNAIAIAAIATVTVQMRALLDKQENKIYDFLHKLLNGDNDVDFTEFQKLVIIFLTAFTVAILVYHLMYLVFGFGRGMLIARRKKL